MWQSDVRLLQSATSNFWKKQWYNSCLDEMISQRMWNKMHLATSLNARESFHNLQNSILLGKLTNSQASSTNELAELIVVESVNLVVSFSPTSRSSRWSWWNRCTFISIEFSGGNRRPWSRKAWWFAQVQWWSRGFHRCHRCLWGGEDTSDRISGNRHTRWSNQWRRSFDFIQLDRIEILCIHSLRSGYGHRLCNWPVGII